MMKKHSHSVLPQTLNVSMGIHCDRLKKFVFFLIWSFLITQFVPQFSFSEEVKDYPSQFALIKSIHEKYTHNVSSIKTWSGDVEVTKKDYTNSDLRDLTYQTDYKVNFLCDYVHNLQKIIITPTICYSYENGIKIPHTLRKESSLWRDNTTYVRELFTPVTPTEFDKRGKILVSEFLQPTNTSFQPTLDSLPFAPTMIESLYLSFDVSEKGIQKKREDGLSEDEISAMHKKMLEGGHPRYILEKEGMIVTIQDKWNEGRVIKISLDQGAYPIFYTSQGKKWTCDLQKVNGVWIPKNTDDLYIASDGTAHHIIMHWKNQKINISIPEEEFTLVKIGARQGDEGYDYRTDTVFTIEGDEYPLPEGMELPFSRKNQIFRIVLISLGVLLIILGGSGTLRKIYKKSA